MGTRLLPVSTRVKLAIVLLAGLSWPFVYAMKLGQVGPLLYLAFACGWRWLDEPRVLGASAAVGTAIKLQPGLLFVWALLSGRWKAVLWGALVLGLFAVAATLVAGASAWTDFLTLIRRVSDPIATDAQLHAGCRGVPAGRSARARERRAGGHVRGGRRAGHLGRAACRAGRRLSDHGGRVAAASRRSWDHYAMLLLLPVAWLLERRQWWAAAVPLVTAVVLVGTTPSFVYPLLFVDRRGGRRLAGADPGVPARHTRFTACLPRRGVRCRAMNDHVVGIFSVDDGTRALVLGLRGFCSTSGSPRREVLRGVDHRKQVGPRGKRAPKSFPMPSRDFRPRTSGCTRQRPSSRRRS